MAIAARQTDFGNWHVWSLAALAGVAFGILLHVPYRQVSPLQILTDIICSSNVVAMTPAGAARPASVVTPISSEVLGPGKRVTTLLVKFPPGAFTPKHTHGGAVSAHVTKGLVRSQLMGQAVGEFRAGQTFFEPVGAVHLFAENPSETEWAELVATVVHDEGVPLTTFIP